MTKARGRGRPKNDPAVNVSQTITFRLTEAEADQCAQAAAKAGLSVSDWVRKQVAKAAKPKKG